MNETDFAVVREALTYAMVHADHLTGCCCAGETGEFTTALDAIRVNAAALHAKLAADAPKEAN